MTGSNKQKFLVDGPARHAPAGVNVAGRLSAMAAERPQQEAVAVPLHHDRSGQRRYETITFADLDADTNRIASGLIAVGARPGMRLALLVRPGIDFIALVFGLLKSQAAMVLIDPGMGRKNALRCLAEVQPDGFVAVPAAQAVRTLMRHRFPKAKLNVTVGRRWFWRGHTLDQIRGQGSPEPFSWEAPADSPAAIIFTTGSTGPPKGVLYTHGNFDQQVAQIQAAYDIRPGEVDVPGFPLFGLFNAAMGVTTVIPDMDPARPAQADPRNIVEAITDFQATQSFGSPALWNVVGKHCERNIIRLPSLRRILSAGAPVPVHVLKRMSAAMADDGEMHTPYGATEALPVASISAREVLEETAAKSMQGAGTCVGKKFSGIDWKIIRISDERLSDIDDCEELARGEIGELVVRGDVVTSCYVTRSEANALHKVADGDSFWHRMGDVGYLDEQDRFWFCGRKAHRVETEQGAMFTIPCEAVANAHPAVYRSALVGVGARPRQTPVIVIETEDKSLGASQPPKLAQEIRELLHANSRTERIQQVLFHPDFPVDIRHNAKIFREQLSVWATNRLRSVLNG